MSTPSDTTTTIHRLTTGSTILLSSLTAGLNLSLSLFLIPRLLESPTPLMLQQWRRTYSRGHAIIPTAALAASAGYLYLGLGSGLGSRLYLVAAGLTVGIVPYTVAVMQVTNGRLMELGERVRVREEKREREEEEEVEAVTAVEVQEEEEEDEVVTVEEERSAKGLVDLWGVLNLGRAALLTAGAACGLAATL
ncbi:hypothetical protein F5144DRAFT_558180 [Chaetomium tenue]|uniref:Uncharacterized protein n=1 Tax=Chaetomium tenue TaxID=1854479 RepID=A0ACB7PRN4_9PEZI|nr:hypothetical protein F5144DRAFT_558180 [Chaetomium globosum]